MVSASFFLPHSTLLIPHSSFHIPHSTLLNKVCTRMCKLYFVLRPIYIIFAT